MASALRVLLVTGSLAAWLSFLGPVSDLRDSFTPAASPLGIGDTGGDDIDQQPHDFPLTAWVTEADYSFPFRVELQITERESPDPCDILTVLASPRSPPQFS